MLGFVVGPVPTALAATLTLAPSSGPAGTHAEATANGFPSGPVTFWWDNETLLGTSPSGRVRRLAFVVPLDAGPGPHTVRACAGSACPPGTKFADATFTVDRAPAATPNPTPKPTAAPLPTAAPTPSSSQPGVLPSAAPTAAPSPVASEGVPGGTVPIGAVTPAPTNLTAGQATGAPVPPGTVKVEFPWLPAGFLGLLAILIVAAAVAGKSGVWIRMRQPYSFFKFCMTGSHPPKPKAPPEPPATLLHHEATHAPPGSGRTVTIEGYQTEGQGPSGPPQGKVPSSLSSSSSPGGGGAAEAGDADATLKGSKIQQN